MPVCPTTLRLHSVLPSLWLTVPNQRSSQAILLILCWIAFALDLDRDNDLGISQSQDASTQVLIWIADGSAGMYTSSGRPLFCFQAKVCRHPEGHTWPAWYPPCYPFQQLLQLNPVMTVDFFLEISRSSTPKSVQIRRMLKRVSRYSLRLPNWHLMSPSGMQSLPTLPDQQLGLRLASGISTLPSTPFKSTAC